MWDQWWSGKISFTCDFRGNHAGPDDFSALLSQPPSSIDDVLSPSHIGWLWYTEKHNKVLYYNADCQNLPPRVQLWHLSVFWWIIGLLVHMMHNTHLIGGQVHAQVCHLFGRAHPASFLPRHEVFICLRETQMTQNIPQRQKWAPLEGQKQCYYVTQNKQITKTPSIVLKHVVRFS